MIIPGTFPLHQQFYSPDAGAEDWDITVQDPQAKANSQPAMSHGQQAKLQSKQVGAPREMARDYEPAGQKQFVPDTLPWLRLNSQSTRSERLRGSSTVMITDQSVCRYFQSPLHIDRLTDSQTASLEMAFCEQNIGKNVIVEGNQNTSERLRQTAEWINARLADDCPVGLQLDLFRLISAEADETIYRSQSKSVRGTVVLPVRPESLSYVDSGGVSCLHIDVRIAGGKIVRADIINVMHALEQEYACRVKNRFLESFKTPITH